MSKFKFIDDHSALPLQLIQITKTNYSIRFHCDAFNMSMCVCIQYSAAVD